MNLTGTMDLPRVKENTLGRRRLPGIDMRDNADIARPLKRNAPGFGHLWLNRTHLPLTPFVHHPF